MNALVRPFALLSLGLTLAACGGGPVTPPGTPVASLNDSGAGSLREAISAAAPGDTLRLTTSGTLTLTRPLVVDKDVTIVAKGVTVDAAGTGRALEIAKGVTVTVTGGTLKGGTGAVLPASVNIHRAEQPGPARQDPRADVHPDRIRLQATTTPPNVGGVLLNRGSLILDGVTVTGGRANLGGGIYNDAGATLTLRGTTTVTGNTATLLDPTDLTLAQGYGGGIYTLGTVNVNGGSVSGNTAVYSGGGLRGGVGSRMTVSGGKVDGNACTLPFTGTSAADADGCAGGGIFTRGDLSITGGSVTNNTATYFGGGVTVQATCTDATCTTLTYPTFTMSGGTVEGNATTGTADNGGGGLWLYSTGTISGGSIRGNRSMYGGGIDSWHDLNITGGAIENNTATENGGGVTLSHDGAYHIGGTARRHRQRGHERGGWRVRDREGPGDDGWRADRGEQRDRHARRRRWRADFRQLGVHTRGRGDPRQHRAEDRGGRDGGRPVHHDRGEHHREHGEGHHQYGQSRASGRGRGAAVRRLAGHDEWRDHQRQPGAVGGGRRDRRAVPDVPHLRIHAVRRDRLRQYHRGQQQCRWRLLQHGHPDHHVGERHRQHGDAAWRRRLQFEDRNVQPAGRQREWQHAR
ncbi:hypothetical protein [Deinococcus sonorensis]|uniref:Right handed beta helix domain-containing protein n=1 Tax=Deinococcus sonorensis KR-87 TaxID=694439 RepID=A0AAU7UHH9_9DEIO